MTYKESVAYWKRHQPSDPRGCYQHLVSVLPPHFHAWFLDAFPEPTAWFESRLVFIRSVAAWSMLGYIIGLGDRHLENMYVVFSPSSLSAAQMSK